MKKLLAGALLAVPAFAGVAAVPEPGTMGLVAAGVIALIVVARRKASRK